MCAAFENRLELSCLTLDSERVLVGKRASRRHARFQVRHLALEAATHFTEGVVGTVSQTFLPGGRRRPNLVVTVGPDTVAAIMDAQETIFRSLLDLKFGDPVLVTDLCRLLEAFQRLIALRKDLVVPAIAKVRCRCFDKVRRLSKVRQIGPKMLQRSRTSSLRLASTDRCSTCLTICPWKEGHGTCLTILRPAGRSGCKPAARSQASL